MLRDNPKLLAAGAFLAGGILVGGITLGTAVAHGAGTGTAGKGLSAPQYEAKNAWVQVVPASQTTLSIPTGDRLTITGAMAMSSGGDFACLFNGIENGVSFGFNLQASEEGNDPYGNGQSGDGATVITSTGAPLQPFSLDSGNIDCNGTVTFVGYLTPIPVG